MNATASSAEPITVMLVDDHPVVRDGYRRLLDSTDDIRVIAEAGDGESACALYAKRAPRVVILDLSMPGIGGLETIRRLRAKDPAARILVFTMHDSQAMVQRTLLAGAVGHLSKSRCIQQMVAAVRAVAAGKRYVETVEPPVSEPAPDGDGEPAALSALSKREFQLFCLLAEGRSVQDIARQLSISIKTVSTHHAAIMRKLVLHNRTELVRLAISCGVIPV